MPIANCIVAPALDPTDQNPVELWADESGKAKQHMTINIVEYRQQFGTQYPIMATLQLPSLWSSSDINCLQVGLARALAKYYQVAIGDVHVITNIIAPGLVVENGEQTQW